MRRIPLVAIIGRTNTGKSTLFNALAGKRVAVTQDEPGVTRDRNYHLVTRFDFPFTVVDTGGIAGEQDKELQHSIRAQALLAVQEADLVVAVFDAKSGPHPHDDDVVQVLRRSGKPVVWVANKTEKEHLKVQAHEFYALGVEPLCFVSAANNLGIKELVVAIGDALEIDPAEAFEPPARDDGAIRLSIVGRPNVGKSTLVNRLVGAERLIAYDKPGTTRDSVDVEVIRDGQKFVLVDTAGLRRKSKVDDETSERFANLRALGALTDCDVAVLIIDATQGIPSDQDIRIGTLIHERGRSFMIVINKWDAIEKDEQTALSYQEAVAASFNFARYAPVLFVSGLTGKRAVNILDKAVELHQHAARTIEQANLDQVMTDALTKNVPPVYHGAPIRFYSVTQAGIRPPTFVFEVNHPRGLTQSYQRYLRSAFREAFPFPGTDMRMFFRKKGKRDRVADGDDIQFDEAAEG